MQIEGAYTAGVMKLIEYVENQEDPSIQTVRTHVHHTNSTLLHTFENLEKSFQREPKQKM